MLNAPLGPSVMPPESYHPFKYLGGYTIRSFPMLFTKYICFVKFYAYSLLRITAQMCSKTQPFSLHVYAPVVVQPLQELCPLICNRLSIKYPARQQIYPPKKTVPSSTVRYGYMPFFTYIVLLTIYVTSWRQNTNQDKHRPIHRLLRHVYWARKG